MKIKYLLLFLIIAGNFSACQKNEGFGGTSTIKGIVIQQNFNDLGEIVDSYEAPDEAYSECRSDTCKTPNVPAIIEIEIEKNNQTVNAQDIIINNF